MLIYLYNYNYYYVLTNLFVFFHLQITVKKHTMVCKACDSYVLSTNDMTLLHLNKCFNAKFNDDHCSIQNCLYCFSCKTITSVQNNKTITFVHNKKHRFDM